jgi:trimeric autotransporter adhesin
VASQDLYFRVRATLASGLVLADQIRTQLTVVSTSTRGFSLSSAGGPRQVAAGGVVDFAYTLRNTGTLTCGGTTDQLKVTATLSAAQATADVWQAVLYNDNGTIVGQYDPSDTLMTSDMLAKLLPGAEHGLIVRVFAPPSGASGGSGVSVVLTVEDQDGPATSCGLQTVTNTVNVSVGQLTVSKFQMLDPNCDSAAQPTASTTITAKPGQCIVYRAKVKNNGSSAVANVTLHDSVPSFTTYHVGGVPTVSCTASGLSPAPTLAVPATGSTGVLSCGGATNTLNSSGEIQLQFRVRINP